MNIKYFLKFGKMDNISGIQHGKVWMSTPEYLRPIEKNLVRGQGDKLEGGMHLHSSKIKLTDNATEKSIIKSGNFDFDIFLDPVNRVPLYCLFIVREKNIVDGKIRLNLETQNVIRNHFPEADSVAVITRPQDFINEFVASVHYDNSSIPVFCRHGEVHYFNMYGVGGENALDGEFIDFITGGRKPERINNISKIPIYYDEVWRHLFCKDLFFKDEQEYRFILPEESVDKGKLFDINITENIIIYEIDEFFDSMKR